ncbi:MAG: hypothetical protein COU06_00165 [Candidatus Harrisonbacteria bacterium CG10_big_fil_rev_8_21_14_0_10_38_8]|uniref:Uncharacterized protein n=1 Tax=Candidatus Harrisonbacteria bacterium CG10_big_fil_rev_8_21_14_0_10_38_8 TaxID=1974582 RepID=A0A2M6WKR7_9BACT|nr:MAG: hypothetical protein COU06_00165 [Candidatus Harrisonbacteria bacterium CG10_big_fil_rev_8_21_14_0_10_38_8]
MKRYLLALSSLLSIPGLAFAQSEFREAPELLPDGAYSLLDIADSVTNWMFTFLMVLAVVFIILAAYKYLTSQGGDGVKEAHKMLAYAAVAVAVALLARGFVRAVETIVGSGPTAPATTASTPTTPSPTTPTVVTLDATLGLSVALCPDGYRPAVSYYNDDVGLKDFPNTQTCTPIATGGCNRTDLSGENYELHLQSCPNGTLSQVTVNVFP